MAFKMKGWTGNYGTHQKQMSVNPPTDITTSKGYPHEYGEFVMDDDVEWMARQYVASGKATDEQQKFLSNILSGKKEGGTVKFHYDEQKPSGIGDFQYSGGTGAWKGTRYPEGIIDVLKGFKTKAAIDKESITIPKTKTEQIPTGKTPGLLPRGKGLTGSAKIDMQPWSGEKKSTFGEEFKKARGEGKTEFEWKGKKFHTRRADESKAEWQKKFKTKKASPGKEPEVKVKTTKTKVNKTKTKGKDKKKKEKEKFQFPFGRKE